jgi:Protein of unknown function (DUF3072)
MVFQDGTPRKRSKKGLQDRLAMMQKKKTHEMQESQQLSPGLSNPAREPMTGAQASYLKMLAEEVREPAAFDQGLSKREATRRIDALMERLRLGELPPHTD